MRKFLALFMSLLLFGLLATTAMASEASGQTVITMRLGSPNMTVNGEVKPIDAEGTTPATSNGRTMLPLRAVAEALGLNVEWDAATQTITLTGGAAAAVVDSVAANNNQSAADDSSEGGKILVAYYSASGNTKAVAEYIAKAAGADLYEITPEQPYTSADLNWNDSGSRVSREHNDVALRNVPLANAEVANWAEYDTVFIGYPIWWGIAAWPVDGFVKANDFTGKTVIPFATSSSSGLGESGKLLADLAGAGDWQAGERFSSSASESTVAAWVNGLNLK